MKFGQRRLPCDLAMPFASGRGNFEEAVALEARGKEVHGQKHCTSPSWGGVEPTWQRAR